MSVCVESQYTVYFFQRQWKCVIVDLMYCFWLLAKSQDGRSHVCFLHHRDAGLRDGGEPRRSTSCHLSMRSQGEWACGGEKGQHLCRAVRLHKEARSVPGTDTTGWLTRGTGKQNDRGGWRNGQAADPAAPRSMMRRLNPLQPQCQLGHWMVTSTEGDVWHLCLLLHMKTWVKGSLCHLSKVICSEHDGVRTWTSRARSPVSYTHSPSLVRKHGMFSNII